MFVSEGKGAQLTESAAHFRASSARDRFDMRADAPRNSATKVNGDRIPDKSAKGGKVDFSALRYEGVVPGEALENRRLSQGNRPVLVRMTKTTVSEAVTLSRHRGRGFVPLHSTIDAWVSAPSFSLMAITD